jgi:hypothetical protein
MFRKLYLFLNFSFVVLDTSDAAVDPAPSHAEIIASIWWVPLAAALIGAISALATPLLKDLVIQRLNERRSKSDQQHEIFRNYAAPLTGACEKLIWRFYEIFIDSRHQFLMTATLPVVFNEYKRKSTLYRTASLLGWIRAIHLELAHCLGELLGFSHLFPKP